MGVLGRIFGRGKSTAQCVGAIRYPDRMLIETQNQVKDGYWIVTDKVSFISGKASEGEIGETIIKHLDLSVTGLANPKKESGFKEIEDRYKKATGLKTLKSQMLDAQYVSICRENHKIIFSPTINGGPSGKKKGYRYKPELDLEIEDTNDKSKIGRVLKMAWNKCE